MEKFPNSEELRKALDNEVQNKEKRGLIDGLKRYAEASKKSNDDKKIKAKERNPIRIFVPQVQLMDGQIVGKSPDEREQIEPILSTQISTVDIINRNEIQDFFDNNPKILKKILAMDDEARRKYILIVRDGTAQIVDDVDNGYKPIAKLICADYGFRETFKKMVAEIIEKHRTDFLSDVRKLELLDAQKAIRNMIQNNENIITKFFRLSHDNIDSEIDGLFVDIPETYSEIVQKIREDKEIRKLFRNLIVQINNETDHHARTAKAQHGGIVRKLLSNQSEKRTIQKKEKTSDRQNNYSSIVIGALCMLILTIFMVGQFVKTHKSIEVASIKVTPTVMSTPTLDKKEVKISENKVKTQPIFERYPTPPVKVATPKKQEIQVTSIVVVEFGKGNSSRFENIFSGTGAMQAQLDCIELPKNISKNDQKIANDAMKELAEIRVWWESQAEKGRLEQFMLQKKLEEYSDKYQELFLKIKIKSLQSKTVSNHRFFLSQIGNLFDNKIFNICYTVTVLFCYFDELFDKIYISINIYTILLNIAVMTIYHIQIAKSLFAFT